MNLMPFCLAVTTLVAATICIADESASDRKRRKAPGTFDISEVSEVVVHYVIDRGNRIAYGVQDEPNALRNESCSCVVSALSNCTVRAEGDNRRSHTVAHLTVKTRGGDEYWIIVHAVEGCDRGLCFFAKNDSDLDVVDGVKTDRLVASLVKLYETRK